MKTTLILLFAAWLLTGTSPATLAQNQKQPSITSAEASELLQRTIGTWLVDFSLWQPQNKEFLKSQGNASISKLQQASHVREQFKITRPDGTIEEGEGFLSYSEANKRFEFVQVDNTGKSTVLLTGQWFAANKTLVLSPERGMEQWGSRNGTPMQLQYTFFDDGTFMKSYRSPDTNGNYILHSQYHYKEKS